MKSRGPGFAPHPGILFFLKKKPYLNGPLPFCPLCDFPFREPQQLDDRLPVPDICQHFPHRQLGGLSFGGQGKFLLLDVL
jgi:hypothetical protein